MKESRFDGSNRAVENLGNLIQRKVLEEEQHEHFTLTGVDPIKGLMDGGRVGHIESSFGPAAFERFFFGTFSGALSAKIIDRAGMGDLIEPRPDGRRLL